MEAESVLHIVKRAEQKLDQIFGSDIVEFEMNNIKDQDKKDKVNNLYRAIDEKIKYNKDILKRATEIQKLSKIRTLDSLHLASAEYANVDIFLTTDDKFEKACSKLDLKIKILNPSKYTTEITNNE
jgi:predicted nucleic acid-binding protein